MQTEGKSMAARRDVGCGINGDMQGTTRRSRGRPCVAFNADTLDAGRRNCGAESLAAGRTSLALGTISHDLEMISAFGRELSVCLHSNFVCSRNFSVLDVMLYFKGAGSGARSRAGLGAAATIL
jgi:hypothetical protein